MNSAAGKRWRRSCQHGGQRMVAVDKADTSGAGLFFFALPEP